MSWELASFLIVGAVLLAGFAWYERSRPTSQVVALVAALAALAIAGRIAFAAFPNVKPTTDIVIFAGFALGPGARLRGRRPHRARLQLLVRAGSVDARGRWWVGGCAAILGAGLAVVRPRAGRFTLAVCLRSGRRRLRRSAELLPDGDLRRRPLPAALPRARVPCRALRRRPRDRQRHPRPDRRAGDGADAGPLPRALRVAGAGRRLGAAGRPCPGERACRPGPRPPTPAAPPSGWPRSRTPTAAGARRRSAIRATDTTAWVMLALESVGHNPLDVSKAGHNPVGYLRAHVDDAGQPGRLRPHDPRPRGRRGRPALLRRPRPGRGAGQAPPRQRLLRRLAGIDRLRDHRAAQRRARGGIDQSTSWLAKVQNGDGGWGDVPGSPSTADGTAAAIAGDSAVTLPPSTASATCARRSAPTGAFRSAATAPSTRSRPPGPCRRWSPWARIRLRSRTGASSALDYLAARQDADGHYR